MSYRFVVCIDVDADNLPGAYKKLRRMMMSAANGEGAFVGWETTDEWYGDGDGLEEGSPSVLQEAIDKVIDEEYKRIVRRSA
jgi:hypothetical protein